MCLSTAPSAGNTEKIAGNTQRIAQAVKLKMLILTIFVGNTILGTIATLFALLSLIGIPLFTCALLPFHLCRFIVGKLAKYLKKDLGKMLTTGSALMSPRTIYKSSDLVMVVVSVLEGNVSLEFVRDYLSEKIINLKSGAAGDLVYPELQQFVCTWGGFYFWKWDKGFSINNHVRYYREAVMKSSCMSQDVGNIDNKKLDEIRNVLTNRGFSVNRSPWEVFVINGYQPEECAKESGKTYTLLILRGHHALGDGYSLLKLLWVQMAGKTMDSIAKPVYVKHNPLLKTLKLFQFILINCFNMVYNLNKFRDRNDWHLPKSEVKGEYYLSVPPSFPVNVIKDIKTAYDVSFTSVLLAAVTGGIRAMMIRKKVIVPKSMQLGAIMPLPRHPDKLRNHLTGILIPLPIGSYDPFERLQEMNEIVQNAKSSPIPQLFAFTAKMVGGVFYWMIPFLSNFSYNTVGLSNFPGPSESLQLFNCPVVAADAVLGMPRSYNMGVGVLAISYAGKLQLSIQIEKVLLSNEQEAEDLSKCILEELYLLHRSIV